MYRVCHGFRLRKQIDYFWVDFGHFWNEQYFWRAGTVLKIGSSVKPNHSKKLSLPKSVDIIFCCKMILLFGTERKEVVVEISTRTMVNRLVVGRKVLARWYITFRRKSNSTLTEVPLLTLLKANFVTSNCIRVKAISESSSSGTSWTYSSRSGGTAIY